MLFTAILLMLTMHLLPKQAVAVQHWGTMSQYRSLPRTTPLQRLFHNVRWRATSKCQISFFFFFLPRTILGIITMLFSTVNVQLFRIVSSVRSILMGELEQALSCLFAKYSEFIHSCFPEFNLFCVDRVGTRGRGVISFCPFYLTYFVKNILLS